jgi:phosphoribosylamine--glycine ligase
MKVLVIGSGAREHAIAWCAASSPRVTKVFCAPGNPGVGAVAQLLPIKATDTEGLLKAVSDHQIGITVVGPEVALEAGVVDLFQASFYCFQSLG